jgi:SAM-dependent methyltransferase
MATLSYKYNASDDPLVEFNKCFTSRIGDGNGDPEEALLDTIRLLARATKKPKMLDIGCGLGRIVDLVGKRPASIVAIEADYDRYMDSFNSFRNRDDVEVLNTTSLQYKLDNPGVRFDLITLSMVIQHVSTSICDEILEDIHDLLDAGGLALVSTTLLDEEKFTFQNDSNIRDVVAFDAYASSSDDQAYGIPVRQFSRESFLNCLQRANLRVIQWGQFSYYRPEKLAWFANHFRSPVKALRDLGSSQFAVVERS